MARKTNDDELEENWVAQDVTMADDDDDVVSVGSEDELDEEDVALASNKRRERDEDIEASDGEDFVDEDEGEAPDQSKKVKKQKENKKKKDKQPESKKQKVTKGIHKMTRAEHFKIVNDAYLKQRGQALTTLELAQALNENHFLEPQRLGKHTLESLPLHLRQLVPAWKKDFKGKGKRGSKSSLLLIVCSSALRAVELLKHLNCFKCHIAKLFGKHLKLDKQKELLANGFYPIAVGTPGRIKKLLESDALSLEHTTHLIFDLYKDKKDMTVLDLKDTAADAMDLLQFHLLPKLNEGKVKIVLY